MKSCKSLSTLAAAIVLAGTANASTFNATDVDGRARQLGASKATVLIFILHDCPVCNRYAPEIDKIDGDYKKLGVNTCVVYEESDLTRRQAKAHAAEYRLSCGLIYDPDHRLAKQVGAAAAPEAVVLDSTGAVAYRGRIDDTFRHFGMAAPKPTSRDVRAAIDDILAGRKVAVAVTPVVGCLIARD